MTHLLQWHWITYSLSEHGKSQPFKHHEERDACALWAPVLHFGLSLKICFNLSAVVADGWNKARMLLVFQPVSDSRGEEGGWRWDGRPGGGVWTDKAWVWHDELKTGHLTLLDNHLTNSSLSPCVCSLMLGMLSVLSRQMSWMTSSLLFVLQQFQREAKG